MQPSEPTPYALDSLVHLTAQTDGCAQGNTTVTMALSWIISDTKRDIGQSKRVIFSYPTCIQCPH